ncbi:MAG: phosphoribosyltransferase [Pseudomonadota bacterium]
MEEMRCEMISWVEVQRLCERLAESIRASRYCPDIVIAIGRGGYIPARLVCDYLGIMELTSIRVEHYLSGSDRQKEVSIRYPLRDDISSLQVLLVDDVNDSGDTLDAAVRHLRTYNPREIRAAVMHNKAVSGFSTDYYARKIVKWRWLIYPWAVNEDISGFLKRLSPAPDSLGDAQKQLAEHFGINVPQQRLRDILALPGR